MTEVEHLDVLVIGAGISGIAAAHDLQAKTPWVDYAIFEGREAMGGTWDLFRGTARRPSQTASPSGTT